MSLHFLVLVLAAAPVTTNRASYPEGARVGSIAEGEAYELKIYCVPTETGGGSEIECAFEQTGVLRTKDKAKAAADVASLSDEKLKEYCGMVERARGPEYADQEQQLAASRAACASPTPAGVRGALVKVERDKAPDCTVMSTSFTLTFRLNAGGKWVSAQTARCGFTLVSELIPNEDAERVLLWTYTQVRVGTVDDKDPFCKAVGVNKPVTYSYRETGKTAKLACTRFKFASY